MKVNLRSQPLRTKRKEQGSRKRREVMKKNELQQKNHEPIFQAHHQVNYNYCV